MANNTGKIIGGLLIGAATAAAAYYGFYYKFEGDVTGWQKLFGKKPEEPKKEPEGGNGEPVPDKNVLPQGGFPIAKGDKNATVARLQKALKGTWKQPIGKVDGDFGNKTSTALNAIGYGDSVASNDTLVKIETGVKPVVVSTSGYGTLTVGKTAFAKVAGHKAAYDLTKGAQSYLDTPKDMVVGTIKRIVGDSVYVQTLAGQYSLDKKFVYTL